MTSRTILIMAGGTGGHVFPALAVADYLKAHGWYVVWLGTRNGLEGKLVPQYGYPMTWVSFSGVRGVGLMRWLCLPLTVLLACLQSLPPLFRFRPNVVLGMGGFASFPGSLMAWLMHRPLVIHEQNAIAGLANRVLARFADRVLVAFPGAFAGKSISHSALDATWCGNPVRAEIARIDLPESRYQGRSGRLRLLVVGGSRGASSLNDSVPHALKLIDQSERPQVVHQGGTATAELLRACYAAVGVEAEVHAFLDDMATRYAWSDLVLCRAGALTIAELAAAGVASVLVPYPHAVDDHQTANARFLSDRHAAVLLSQIELTPERLANLIRGFTRDKLLEMAKAARALAIPDATERVARICMEVAG
ncbi:MAG: undecaprenyldiphospho-muramoylpentapeptide beta-N-acetylglucosaminyltransferase [Burkholderiales bacterium]